MRLKFTPEELKASMRPEDFKRLFPCGLEPITSTGVCCALEERLREETRLVRVQRRALEFSLLCEQEQVARQEQRDD